MFWLSFEISPKLSRNLAAGVSRDFTRHVVSFEITSSSYLQKLNAPMQNMLLKQRHGLWVYGDRCLLKWILEDLVLNYNNIKITTPDLFESWMFKKQFYDDNKDLSF